MAASPASFRITVARPSAPTLWRPFRSPSRHRQIEAGAPMSDSWSPRDCGRYRRLNLRDWLSRVGGCWRMSGAADLPTIRIVVGPMGRPIEMIPAPRSPCTTIPKPSATPARGPSGNVWTGHWMMVWTTPVIAAGRFNPSCAWMQRTARSAGSPQKRNRDTTCHTERNAPADTTSTIANSHRLSVTNYSYPFRQLDAPKRS
jgi:hypothetical protein